MAAKWQAFLKETDADSIICILSWKARIIPPVKAVIQSWKGCEEAELF